MVSEAEYKEIVECIAEIIPKMPTEIAVWNSRYFLLHMHFKQSDAVLDSEYQWQVQETVKKYHEKLLPLAETEASVFEFLLFGIGTMIAAELTLPEDLENFLIDYLMGIRQKPVKKGRAKKPELEDVSHACLVYLAVEKGLKATRNVGTELKYSACDAVSDAYKANKKFTVSYETVKNAHQSVKTSTLIDDVGKFVDIYLPSRLGS